MGLIMCDEKDLKYMLKIYGIKDEVLVNKFIEGLDKLSTLRIQEINKKGNKKAVK